MFIKRKMLQQVTLTTLGTICITILVLMYLVLIEIPFLKDGITNSERKNEELRDILHNISSAIDVSKTTYSKEQSFPENVDKLRRILMSMDSREDAEMYLSELQELRKILEESEVIPSNSDVLVANQSTYLKSNEQAYNVVSEEVDQIIQILEIGSSRTSRGFCEKYSLC